MPICHPTQTPWGQKAFNHYLGSDQVTWENYDATVLLSSSGSTQPMLIDQGMDDQFLKEELSPEILISIAYDKALNVDYRFQEGYDHSYYFIATFIADHLRFHAKHIK